MAPAVWSITLDLARGARQACTYIPLIEQAIQPEGFTRNGSLCNVSIDLYRCMLSNSVYNSARNKLQDLKFQSAATLKPNQVLSTDDIIVSEHPSKNSGVPDHPVAVKKTKICVGLRLHYP